jgi:hypothetical protein
LGTLTAPIVEVVLDTVNDKAAVASRGQLGTLGVVW